METGISSSFIPKDATVPTAPRRQYEGGGLGDVVSLIAVVLFIASVALAGAAFLYQQYLNSESASKLAQIQRAQAEFDPSLIEQLTRLDDRMQAAETLLKLHIAPSAFFGALNQATLTTVSFTSLDFNASDPENVTIKMQGVAQSVNSIALQAQLFAQNGVITNPIFSGIDRESDGVHFDLTASVNPAAINYATLIEGGTPSGVNALPQTTTQPSQATTAPSSVTQTTAPSFQGPTTQTQQSQTVAPTTTAQTPTAPATQ